MKDPQMLIAAFYKFAGVKKPVRLKVDLLGLMQVLGVRGTILIAPEGVNGTISGEPEAVKAVLAQIRREPGFADMEHKEAFSDAHAFKRTKVKLKKEIITFKQDCDPSKSVGEYVEPKDWNRLIEEDGVIVIDTRNDYEVEMGRFKGAVDPKTKCFTEIAAFTERELADVRDKKIAMYCTGGIRCEKYSSYLLAQGFSQVYHLKGGIIKYLQEMPQEKSMFEGKCYVFDERVGV